MRVAKVHGVIQIARVRCALARAFLGCLLMAALGLAQVVGISRGFWCDCDAEPKMVGTAMCEPSVCHETDTHAHEGCQEADAEEHDLLFHEPDTDDTPGGGDHRHREARESLKTTAVGTAIPMAPPLVCDLPPSVLSAPLAGGTLVPFPRAARLRWIPDGSPPTPLLVVRTMVRLV